MPKTDRYPFRADIRGQLVGAASAGGKLVYSDMPGGRFMWGRYLYRITREEDDAGRPPLSAVVVTKANGRPAPGFLKAMREIKYVRSGESEQDVWKRALAEVHEFWRPKLVDELHGSKESDEGDETGQSPDRCIHGYERAICDRCRRYIPNGPWQKAKKGRPGRMRRNPGSTGE